MHPALRQTDHRPWALPRGPWVMRQSWLDLLFAHWPAPAAALRALVPPSIAIQEHDGTSWVGVVPFRMGGRHGDCPVRPRCCTSAGASTSSSGRSRACRVGGTT